MTIPIKRRKKKFGKGSQHLSIHFNQKFKTQKFLDRKSNI